MQYIKGVNLSEYIITSKAEAQPMIKDDKLFKLDNVDNVGVLVKKAEGDPTDYYEECAFSVGEIMPWYGLVDLSIGIAEVDRPSDVERAEKLLDSLS